MPVALASQLREGTKKSHTMAENTGFVSCFLKGVVDKGSYRTLVADLYFVYAAMEEEMARLADHPVIAPIAFAELNRREALEQDLAYYYGADWLQQIKATPAAQIYVERIRQVAKESPELLVGHHYTRYLGDLSGGQILKNIAQKAMNLVRTMDCTSIPSPRSPTKRPSKPPIALRWTSFQLTSPRLIAWWRRPIMPSTST